MSFNRDPSKQAQEVIFCRKIKKPNHPELILNKISVNQASYRKYLGMFLNNKLTFGEHLSTLLKKLANPLDYLISKKKSVKSD